MNNNKKPFNISERLQVAHKSESLSLTITIVEFNQDIAIVKSSITTEKGVFEAIGSTNSGKGVQTADVLIEVAQTKAIESALQFAGFGFECGAEMIHLNGFSQPKSESDVTTTVSSQKDTAKELNKRLTGKQYKYILKLFGTQGLSKDEMDAHCIEAYGISLQHLNRSDASSLIETLIQQAESSEKIV